MILGIDLAAQPKKTYACVLDGNEAMLHATCDDAMLRELAAECEKVAIDSPFGWPVAFVDALNAHRRFERWPAPHDDDPQCSGRA
jgi:hypothetical protein